MLMLAMMPCGLFDGLAQFAEGEEYPHAVVVQVRAGFQ